MTGRHHRTVDGIRIAEAGDPRAPAILFLHGIGSSAAAFDAQIAALSATYRCLAWDAPGYAGSADPDTAPGMSGYADAAAKILRTLDAAPAHVVGVSWGGVIATRLALEHPKLLRSLVLVDSTRGSGTDAAKADAMLARAAELNESGPTAFAEARAPRLLSPHAPAGLVARVAQSMAESIRLPGYGYAAQAMAETDHSERLGGIEVPTLVVVGAYDVVTTVEESERIVRSIAGAQLDIVPAAGHLSNQEQPEKVTARIATFLRRVDADTPPALSGAGGRNAGAPADHHQPGRQGDRG